MSDAHALLHKGGIEKSNGSTNRRDRLESGVAARSQTTLADAHAVLHKALMSHPVADERGPVSSDERTFGLRIGWPHEYLHVERDKREREREMLPEGRQRIPFNEDCLRWRPPRRRDGKPL